MPYSTNLTFAWPRPAAGQQITITWSYADLDAVDKILMGGQTESYVTPSGNKISFGGYRTFLPALSTRGETSSAMPSRSGIRIPAYSSWKSLIARIRISEWAFMARAVAW